LVLSIREPEQEIEREPLRIAFDLLIQPLDWNAVKLGQICIENDFLIA